MHGVVENTQVLLIIDYQSTLPTQIGVTVFLIYGLCTQDVTAHAYRPSKYVLAKKLLIVRTPWLPECFRVF